MVLPLATPSSCSSRRARSLAERAQPLVLTARSLLRSRPDLAPALATVRLELRAVASWDRLLDVAERIQPDVILIDLDAADESARLRRGLSGHRIVALLARQCGAAMALVVLTRLDFAEIEDLARAGISDLLSPQMPAKALAGRLCAIAARARGRQAVAPVPRQAPADAGADAVPMEAAMAQAEAEAIWPTVCMVFADQPASRSPFSNRQVLAAAFYLLRTGASWSALPPALGSVRTVRRRLSQWRDSGTLESLRAVLAANGITLPAVRWERLAGLAAAAVSTPSRARQLVAVAR